MQAGNLVASDVQAYTSRILVNGVQRDFVSWSVDRELSGDLPVQVVAVSGITQATGSVEWAAETDIEDGSRNPWNHSTGWMPTKGDRVEIYVGDGVTEWKQFHGVIDRTTGDLEAGFQSTVIDDYDNLSATVSHQALLRVMPPASGGGEAYRGIGLMALYYVDHAMRQAGFHCTPSSEYNAALTVYGQGSIWPARGSLSSTSSSSSHASMHVAPWGLALSSFEATYSLWGSHDASEPVQITMNVAPGHTGVGYLHVSYVTGHVRLQMDGRVATVIRSGTTIGTLNIGAATVVSLLAKGGAWTLRTNTGATATGSMSMPSDAASTAIVSADANSRLAGFQVSFPERTVDELRSTYHVPNARLDTSSLYLNGIIDAAPTIENRTAQDLLQEIGDATLSAMWIDETGVMQWVPSDALRDRTPSRTVTTLDDVLSLSWEDGLLGTASKVTAKGRKPGITKGRWKTVVLARGGGSNSMKSGDELEIFLEPDGDSDWIQPSTTFLQVGGSGAIWGSANNPDYSLTGLYYSADGGTTEATGLNVTITTEVLGLQKVLVKYVAGNWPSDVEGVLSTSPTAETLWPKNRDKELPKLVGAGRVEWTDQQVVATGAGGPGPELVHEVGPWGCRTDSTIMLDRYASYIQLQTSKPLPVINGLGIVPDPRLQLGDVITISSPDLMGVTMTALIVGVSSSFGSSYEQSLTVRIINVTTTYTSYAEYNDSLASSSLTYAQWQALGPIPQTYTQFNNS